MTFSPDSEQAQTEINTSTAMLAGTAEVRDPMEIRLCLRLLQKELSDTQGVTNTAQEFTAPWILYPYSQSSTTERKIIQRPSKGKDFKSPLSFACSNCLVYYGLLVSTFPACVTKCLSTGFPKPSLPVRAEHSQASLHSLEVSV